MTRITAAKNTARADKGCFILAEDTYEPVCLRRLFACLVGIDEIDRSCKSDLPYRIKEDQEKDQTVYYNGAKYGLAADDELITRIKADHLPETEFCELGKADADQKSACDRNKSGY